MGDRTLFSAKNCHSLAFLFLLFLDLKGEGLFFKYMQFKAMAGAESELDFDPFTFNWKLVNVIFLALNGAGMAAVLAGFFLKDFYRLFRLPGAFLFFLNVLYPSAVVMLFGTGFHFIPFSVMLLNGYGFLALGFFKNKWGLIQPVEEEKKEIPPQEHKDTEESEGSRV
jgi:hypothetical protein